MVPCILAEELKELICSFSPTNEYAYRQALVKIGRLFPVHMYFNVTVELVDMWFKLDVPVYRQRPV
jgi:hypothetical protein